MLGNKRGTIAILALAVALATGCAGDMTKQLMSDPNLQTKVMDLIGGNGGMAGQMIDKLVGSDSTRTMVVEKLLANGGATQSIMAAVAKDQTMVDGVLNLAVQDPAMRDHIMTLLKGMQMAGGGAK